MVNQRTTNQNRRGSLQLWQFLVSLLDDPNNASCIMWTGRGTEFKLVEPEEVWIIEKIFFLKPRVSTFNNNFFFR